MPYKVLYTCTIEQTDLAGNVVGDTYTFTGSQLIPDILMLQAQAATTATAHGTDMQTKMQSIKRYSDGGKLFQ